MTAWSVSEVPVLRGLTLEWADVDSFVFSWGNRLYSSTTLGPPFKGLGEIPIPSWKKLAALFRPGQRLLRQFVYNIIRLHDGSLFITFDKTVGILKNGKFLFRGSPRASRSTESA